MKFGWKIAWAILGGCNVIFQLFAPLAISVLWILQFGTKNVGSNIILIVAILATIYKAIDYLAIKQEEG